MHKLTYLLAFIILYVYFLYPLVIYLFSLVIYKRVGKEVKNEEYFPTVSLMIAAYNEEASIEAKILNSLKLDYPKEKLNIIVVSDASSDNTDNIVKKYESKGIKLLRVEGRVGKTEARNIAVKKDQSEIIIFSDATTDYEVDSIKLLIRNFNDSKVGMVSGFLKYRSSQNSTMGTGQKLYWHYESLLKKSQTRLGTLTGSLGCMTAFRRELYTELPANIIEDFTAPLMIIQKGYRVVFEEDAICYEETTSKSTQEWGMRVRVIRGGLTGLSFARSVLNPFKHLAASVQLISHKVLRWLIPVFAILLLVSTIIATMDHQTMPILVLLAMQILFYALVAIAFVCENIEIKLPLINIPYYLFIVNLASLVAIYKFITEELEPTWNTDREGIRT